MQQFLEFMVFSRLGNFLIIIFDIIVLISSISLLIYGLSKENDSSTLKETIVNSLFLFGGLIILIFSISLTELFIAIAISTNETTTLNATIKQVDISKHKSEDDSKIYYLNTNKGRIKLDSDKLDTDILPDYESKDKYKITIKRYKQVNGKIHNLQVSDLTKIHKPIKYQNQYKNVNDIFK